MQDEQTRKNLLAELGMVVQSRDKLHQRILVLQKKELKERRLFDFARLSAQGSGKKSGKNSTNYYSSANTLSEADQIYHENIVQFYGAGFLEGDCCIIMELMDKSLNDLKHYRRVFVGMSDLVISGHFRSFKAILGQFWPFFSQKRSFWIIFATFYPSFPRNFHKTPLHIFSYIKTTIPQPILSRILLCQVRALQYLKNSLKIIHRDVKPSNMLFNRKGQVKLCDFGISGRLIDSVAMTRSVGCQSYMAPERINPDNAGDSYDIRADVWSLGISLYELATGKFPYMITDVFTLVSKIVEGEPPSLKKTMALQSKQI